MNKLCTETVRSVECHFDNQARCIRGEDIRKGRNDPATMYNGYILINIIVQKDWWGLSSIVVKYNELPSCQRNEDQAAVLILGFLRLVRWPDGKTNHCKPVSQTKKGFGIQIETILKNLLTRSYIQTQTSS